MVTSENVVARGRWWSRSGVIPQTGKRRQQWRTVHGTKKDAERELRELMQRIETGGFAKPSRLTLGAFLERWLRDYAASNTAPRTLEGYHGIVRRYLLPELGSLDLEHLAPRHIQGLYGVMSERGLSARTILHTHRVLKEALGHGVRWQILSRNPADAVIPPRPLRREMSVLDTDGISKFLAIADDAPHLTIFLLALYTGMRRSEILGLRWPDVNLDSAALSVTQGLHRVIGEGLVATLPKTPQSRRRIALSQDTVSLLRFHKARQAAARLEAGPAWQDGGWVFARPDGRPIDPNDVTRAFTRIIRAAGLHGVRFHDLRHTHATLMLTQGVHPKVVSERLGHSTVTITLDTYSHVLPGLQEAAAEAFAEGLRGVVPRGVVRR